MTTPTGRRRLPLNTSASVTLDANGNGTASIGPEVGQRWFLTVAALYIPATNSFPVCNVYVGSEASADNIVDTSYSGAGDSTGRVTGYPLTHGQKVWAVWTGGPANTRATLSLYGEQES